MKRLFGVAASVVAVASCLSTQIARAADNNASSNTELTFSVSGEVRSAPTLLTAHLFAQAQRLSAVDAQKILNATIADAMKMASKQAGIDVKAGSYSISDYTPEHGHTQWTARQNIKLSGKDAVSILDLSGKLQSHGLMLEGLDWSLDAKTRDTLTQQARTQALSKVKAQAEESAKALGLHLIRLEKVDISSFQPEQPYEMLQARVGGSAMEAPQSSPESQVVKVTVNVKAILAP
ncbi:SIMPL domain-containing protein [Swingsia samuiensis]|uniref:DUF541 domain-containing protein n=1 Tax=Swingsia samuiensis TaxID=1293412 RepID=A0A4Y6UHQ7_9PROT|nr:SIMPL domain-containing protein [Swingsia samuiensis]QDH17042.1 DUF541 domain-containing protein [Swingsia samuiensis]